MADFNEPGCMFSAYITNLRKYTEGDLVGEWVNFPTTSEKIQEVFKRIGIDRQHEEIFITDYSSKKTGLTDKLGEHESLSALNYLANQLYEMDESEREQFEAMLDISDYTNDVKDLINLTENLEKYDLYPDITSQEELGRDAIENSGLEIPDEIRDYIDYEAYGRDIWLNELAVFTDYGYIRDNQSEFQEVFDGKIENIPEEYALDTRIPEQPVRRNGKSR